MQTFKEWLNIGGREKKLRWTAVSEDLKHSSELYGKGMHVRDNYFGSFQRKVYGTMFFKVGTVKAT